MDTITKLFHTLDLKVNRSTCYSTKPFTLHSLIEHTIIHHVGRATRATKGLFGFCDHCGGFNLNLDRVPMDMEYDMDEDGPTSYVVYGRVCIKCAPRLEVI